MREARELRWPAAAWAAATAASQQPLAALHALQFIYFCPMASVRLYVGGLPAGVSAPELEARFTPFGEVTAMQLAPAKQYGDAAFSRDFAHVSLRPKDEAALRKCISAYNGCKWKGGVLRCGLARQHYAERLAAERAGGGGGSGGPQQDAEVRPRERAMVAKQFAGCMKR